MSDVLPARSSTDVPTAGERALSRRGLLRSGAIAGLGAAVLAACGDAGGTADVAAEPSSGTGGASGSPTEVDQDQELAAVIEAAGFADRAADWTVIVATFEVVTGPDRRLQFGLLDESRSPAQDREVQAVIVSTGTDVAVAQEATTPIYHGEGLGIRGVYAIETALESPGIHYLVVATEDHVGAAALRVIDPESSLVAQIGDPFPVVATPTTEAPGDLEDLCTREPDCSMHEVSLDTALEGGRPVVLTIATPKYCQTAVCGPVVDVVEDIHQELGDDIAFIHVEVFTDAGNTPTQVVQDLQLPSEPWTFLIGADGVLVDRFDGPVVPSLLRESIDTLLVAPSEQPSEQSS